MSLSSEEVNFLIYRYMLESGFIHSAYAFGHESLILKSNIDGSAVPPGALVSLIQKGLQYMEIEAHINDDGTETVCDEEFSVLEPHTCSVKNKRKIFDPYEPMEEDYGPLEATYERVSVFKGHSDMVTSCAFHPSKLLVASGAGDAEVRVWEVKEDLADKKRNARAAKPASRRGRKSSKNKSTASHRASEHPKIRAERITTTSMVLRSSTDSAPSDDVSANATVKQEAQTPDSLVVTVEWNRSGTLLANGFYDGRVCIWDGESGALVHTLTQHTGPISSVRWCKKDNTDLLLSTSVDKSVIVWDAAVGEAKQTFSSHNAPVLDADWKDATTFATCSSDGSVHVCSVDHVEPVMKLQGHNSDVNMVRWDPSGKILASCSDDCSVKIWVDSQEAPVHSLEESDREICVIAWGKGSSGKAILASGSLDCLIRLWDIDGKGIMTIDRHAHPVTVLKFSPNGKFLASASYDRLHVFTVKNGDLLVTHKSMGSINDLSWNAASNRIAVALTDASMLVLDIAPRK